MRHGTQVRAPLGILLEWQRVVTDWLAELAGDFAVWLASPEADFLHGRYVESGWDLDELRKGETRETLEKDPWYLKVGILGLHP